MQLRWPSRRTPDRDGPRAQRFRQAEQVSSVTQGDRTVLLDLRSEQFFSLDDVGLRIWERLGRTASVDEIAAELSTMYDAPADEIRRDVEAFVTRLVTDRLAVEVR
jgi:hypothetical protein